MSDKSSDKSSANTVVSAGLDSVSTRLVSVYLEQKNISVVYIRTLEEGLETLEKNRGTLFLTTRVLRDSTPEVRKKLSEKQNQWKLFCLLEYGEGLPGDDIAAPLILAGALEKPLHPAEVVAAIWHEAAPEATGPVLPAADLALQGLSREKPAPDAEGSPDALEGFTELVREMEMEAELADDLLSSFQERARSYMERLEQALKNREALEIGKIAHSIKGMAGNLRFKTIVASSEELRRAAGLEDWDSVGPLLKQTCAMMSDRVAEIDDYRAARLGQPRNTGG